MRVDLKLSERSPTFAGCKRGGLKFLKRSPTWTRVGWFETSRTSPGPSAHSVFSSHVSPLNIVTHFSFIAWLLAFLQLFGVFIEMIFLHWQYNNKKLNGVVYYGTWKETRQSCCPFYKYGLTLIPVSIIKCGIKLLIHSYTSMVQPLKFRNGWVISSHTFLGM